MSSLVTFQMIHMKIKPYVFEKQQKLVYKCSLLPHDVVKGVNVYITSGNFQTLR